MIGSIWEPERCSAFQPDLKGLVPTSEHMEGDTDKIRMSWSKFRK